MRKLSEGVRTTENFEYRESAYILYIHTCTYEYIQDPYDAVELTKLARHTSTESSHGNEDASETTVVSCHVHQQLQQQQLSAPPIEQRLVSPVRSA